MAHLRAVRRPLEGADENAAAGPAGAKHAIATRMTRAAVQRAALGDVANRVTRNQQKQPFGKAPPPAKQPTKPVLAGLSRQTATARLVKPEAKAQTYSLRSATAKPEDRHEVREEPMETEDDRGEGEMDTMDADVPAALVPMDVIDEPVEDIDKDDGGNPQAVFEYVNEIYAYLRQLEARQAVTKDYLSPSKDRRIIIKPKMRNLLVNWLVEVHGQFKLLQETLYLTVSTLDRYLQASAPSVTTKHLQLVGVTSMFIASKYEEMYPPEIGDFVYITDKAYTASQIRQMEIKIMVTLNFDFGRPLSLNFLRRGSKAGGVDPEVHCLAKYALELCLLEYSMAHLAPSLVAAAALAFSMRLLDSTNTPLRHLWTRTLEHYTSYTLTEILPVVSSVAAAVSKATNLLESTEASTAGTSAGKILDSVAKKYKGKKYMKVALIPELRTNLVDEMAQEGGYF